jgi:hypothetical protein
MNSTKKTPNAHKRSSKASFIIHKMLLQILAARFTMREWERERREWEKFGQHRLALKIDGEKRRGGLSFKGGRQGRPLLHALQVAAMQEGAPLKGGAP